MKLPGGEYCSICGNPAQGVWHPAAGDAVACCHTCAVDCLPALIADAVQVAGQRPDELQTLFHHIELRFWRAMALRLHNDRKGNE
jgi:hypothetical protein